MVKPQDFFKSIDNSLLLNSIDVNNTEENELSQTLSVSTNEMFEINNKILMATKIEGKYIDYIKNIYIKNLNKSTNSEDLIVIDSYDGAEHLNTGKRNTSIISFSSTMISTSYIAKGEDAASSFDILTWQQIIAAETASNIFPVVENVFQNKKEIFDTLNNNDNDIKFSYYEVHDGRMIYMLTQHSLFNRKHHPFVLCKCKTGDGV